MCENGSGEQKSIAMYNIEFFHPVFYCYVKIVRNVFKIMRTH